MTRAAHDIVSAPAIIDRLYTKAISPSPGYTYYRLTRDHVDANGVTHPKGATCVPLCGGAMNGIPGARSYQDVTMRETGKRVRFLFKD